MQPLVVGTTSGYAPYVSLNAKGQYEGFDIDLATQIAKDLGRPLEIRDFGTMPGLMLALKQGRADLLMWAVSITEERSRSMEMIYYQGSSDTEAPVLFWEKIPENTQALGDLSGVICVEAGSFQESVVNTLPGIKITYVDSVTDAVLNLRYGKAAAILIDAALLPRMQAQYPQIQVQKVPLPPELVSSGNGICVQKGNLDLAEKVRKIVERLRADGTLADLEKKWGLAESR